MKHFFSLLVAGAATSGAWAAEINTLAAQESAEGWKLLFDGTTLSGWHIYQHAGPPKAGWHVAEGLLVCPKSNGRPNGSGGDLVTDGKYRDFDFRFEWRISPGGNSGVKYLVDESRPPGAPLYRGDTGNSPVGFEYQLLDDVKHPDAKRGPTHMSGAIYDLLAMEKKTLKPVGQWNESRIVVGGNHVEHWLNGGKVAECDLDSDAFRQLLAKSKYSVIPGFGTKITTPLALQDHGEEVAFRNLKIRELKPNEMFHKHSP
jgi:hypothetical protein